jgi:hypothetical protein
LDFDKVPTKELEHIWNTLGMTKPNPSNLPGSLVMTVTKPLMFIWGQTPAFDELVRQRMPMNAASGFRNNRWEFSLFLTVLKELQATLLNNSALRASMSKISIEKYGTDKVIPYGQFIDLCFWNEKSSSLNMPEVQPKAGKSNEVRIGEPDYPKDGSTRPVTVRFETFTEKDVVDSFLWFCMTGERGEKLSYIICELSMENKSSAIHVFDAFNSFLKPRAFETRAIHPKTSPNGASRLVCSWSINKKEFGQIVNEVQKSLGDEWSEVFAKNYACVSD